MIKKDRQTLETQIKLELAQTLGSNDLDMGIETGVGFFNHMLTLFKFHSGLYIGVEAQGDTDVDDHHTVEDIGILLGEAIRDLPIP